MLKSITTNKQEKILTLSPWQREQLEKMGYEKVRESSYFQIRFDDRCNNGYNTFAITGTIYDKNSPRNDCTSCGCLHDEFALVFPELKHLLKWHLESATFKGHAIENILYLAGDLDYNGKRKGEVSRTEKKLFFKGFESYTPCKKEVVQGLENGGYKTDPELLAIPHENNKEGGYQYNPKFYFENMPNIKKWYQAPFDSEKEALALLKDILNNEWEIKEVAVAWSNGKERELDKARSYALAEGLTDEQLSLPREELKALLLERLPAVQAQFKKDVESLGFTF
jgi:hypothetical protein